MTRRGEEQERHRDPRSDGAALVRRQSGRDERPELVEQDGHREDDPDDQRDLDLDDERVADPQDLEGISPSGSMEEVTDLGRDEDTRWSS